MPSGPVKAFFIKVDLFLVNAWYYKTALIKHSTSDVEEMKQKISRRTLHVKSVTAFRKIKVAMYRKALLTN